MRLEGFGTLPANSFATVLAPEGEYLGKAADVVQPAAMWAGGVAGLHSNDERRNLFLWERVRIHYRRNKSDPLAKLRHGNRHRRSVDMVRDFVGADSLAYLSLDGLVAATGAPKDSFCRACFDGEYPVPVGDAEPSKFALETR